MKLVNIISNRAKMADVNNDNATELVNVRLSTILVSNPLTGKLIKKIVVKPKVERSVEEYNRTLLRSVSTSETLIERPSISGEIIIKFELEDINNDGSPEFIILRADGIMACYNFREKELWSIFKDPYVQDFCLFDIDNDGFKEIIAISRIGNLYIINHKGKVTTYPLEGIFGSPAFIGSIQHNGCYRLFVIVRDGVLYFLDIPRDSKGIFKRKKPLNVLNTIGLPKTGEPVIIDTQDINEDGREEIIIGFSDGKLIIVGSEGTVLQSYELQDKIAFIATASTTDGNLVVIGDWIGNSLIIKKRSVQIIPALERTLDMDIDNDGIVERIQVRSKKLVIKKNQKEILSVEGRSYITAFNLQDIDADDEVEVLVGWNSRSFSIYKTNGSRIASTTTSAIPRVLLCIDVDNDGQKEILCGGEGTLEIYKL